MSLKRGYALDKILEWRLLNFRRSSYNKTKADEADNPPLVIPTLMEALSSIQTGMNAFDLQPLPELMVNVLGKSDQQSLKEFIDKVDLYLIVEESEAGDLFPDSVFEFLLKLMDFDVFLAMEGSSKLLLVFETDWVRLSEEQKQNLLVAIGKSYERFADRMSCFIAAELLGQYYCNEDAFRLLSGLRKTAKVIARAFIPHGFEHIAKSAADRELRKRAIAELNSLQQDPSPDVQAEAAESLGRLPRDL